VTKPGQYKDYCKNIQYPYQSHISDTTKTIQTNKAVVHYGTMTTLFITQPKMPTSAKQGFTSCATPLRIG
jgi:hypothetical protein